MSMRIEELIKQRKERLDVETPPEALWAGIRSDWKTPAKPTYHWWKIAAMVLMGLCLGLVSYSLYLKNEMETLASLSDISQEYAHLEKHYKKEVSQLENALNLTQISEKDDYHWILDELQALEKINNSYRADIGKGFDEDQLVPVLIDYYEKRLRLLKKLQLEIGRSKLKTS